MKQEIQQPVLLAPQQREQSAEFGLLLLGLLLAAPGAGPQHVEEPVAHALVLDLHPLEQNEDLQVELGLGETHPRMPRALYLAHR